MLRPLISVIVPIYNVEAYLPQCLDSIVGQTYPHLEIILVNDGSPDNSLAICEDYASRDERIRVVSRPNGGLSAARNTGLELVTGQYVSFVDSDDWLELDTYERCVEALAKYPDLDVLSFGYCYERATGTELVERSERLYQGREYFQEYALDNARSAIVCNKIYRASLLRTLRFEEGLLHEDEYFSLSLYAMHPQLLLYELSHIGYHYRLGREGSITYRRGERNCRDLITGYGLVLDRFIHEGGEVLSLVRSRILRTMIYIHTKEMTIAEYRPIVERYYAELFPRLRGELPRTNLQERLQNSLYLRFPECYVGRWGGYLKLIVSIVVAIDRRFLGGRLA